MTYEGARRRLCIPRPPNGRSRHHCGEPHLTGSGVPHEIPADSSLAKASRHEFSEFEKICARPAFFSEILKLSGTVYFNVGPELSVTSESLRLPFQSALRTTHPQFSHMMRFSSL